ncbi:hypothetical protein Tco_1437080 [Tanacetum coccineum]
MSNLSTDYNKHVSSNHEDAMNSDVDEGPNAAVAIHGRLVIHLLSQEMHQEEHLDSDAETETDDNTIPYHQYLLDTEAQNVPNLIRTAFGEDIRSACDREHTKVLELEAENTTKTAWRPTGKVVGSVKPHWKPTGLHFALYDNCPLTRIIELIIDPFELTPSVSSSSKVTMISRSKGRTVADSIAERLTRPTAYKFKTDCSIIPVWRMTTQSFRCKTHAHIHTTVSEVIKKEFTYKASANLDKSMSSFK